MHPGPAPRTARYARWLALLLGCLHYDLGEREQAEAARQAAYHAGLQAGHGEIVAWSYELAAWLSLTEGATTMWWPMPRQARGTPG